MSFINDSILFLISILHLIIILFIIITPFTDSNYLLLIHIIIIPFIVIHWILNDNTCCLTTTENFIRQISYDSKIDEKDSFSYKLISPVYDFNKNYGSWRHIFHKGTDIKNGAILDYQSWENLVKDIPNQVIGVWLAPFTNNLRIAVKTTTLSNRTYGSYADAFVEKCDDTGNCFITDMPSGKWTDNSKASDGSNPNTKVDSYLEYFDQDLQNIPINSQVNIIINFRNNNAEVYYNGKIVKITQLDGTPNSDKSNLYVLNDKTVNCEISNLLYFPDAIKLSDVQQIISIAPQIQ